MLEKGEEAQTIPIENPEESNNNRIRLAVYNIQKEFRIYHVAVLVHGREFHYGMRIGTFECEPMNGGKVFHVRYWRKMIHWRIEFMRFVDMLKEFPLVTNFSLEQLQKVQQELGQRFTRQNYHLLNHNCLDFAREFIRRIAVKVPPSRCWPQEIRQPFIILPIRLFFRMEERKALRMEREGQQNGEDAQLKTAQPILHITNIKIMPLS